MLKFEKNKSVANPPLPAAPTNLRKRKNMDTIFINRLQVPAIIGVFEQERTATQTLQVSATLFTPIHAASSSDDINDTVSYAEVRTVLLQRAAQTQYQLIEALADDLAHTLLNTFEVHKVAITVYKKPFDINDANEVGVRVERQRQHHEV